MLRDAHLVALLLQGGYMDHARKHVRAGPQRSASFSDNPSVQNSLQGTLIDSSGRDTPKHPPLSGIFTDVSVAAPGAAPHTPMASAMQTLPDNDGENEDDESDGAGNGTFLEVPSVQAAGSARAE